MRGVLTGFAVIAAVIAVGYLLGRREMLGHDAAQVLARVVFFVATPALLFETLARADVRTVVWAMLLVTVVSTTAVIAVFAAVARMWWRRTVSEITVGALASSYVNAANLGIPITVHVLGDASYVAAVLLFQLLVMAPVAFAVLDTAATPDRRSLLKVVSRPLRNPVTVASGLGLACSVAGWLPPEPVIRPIELIGGMAVPAALIAYGVSLHGAERPALWRRRQGHLAGRGPEEPGAASRRVPLRQVRAPAGRRSAAGVHRHRGVADGAERLRVRRSVRPGHGRGA